MENIVVIGGGFAGLWSALSAARERHIHDANFNITLITKDEYLTIRPRLYESEPENLRVPLRRSLDPVNINLCLGEVDDIDIKNQSISYQCSQGTETLPYKKLILATGSQLQTLPVTGATEYTWNTDNYDAAVKLEQHIKKILQDGSPDSETFVVIGAGFTGIEIATELRIRIKAHTNNELAERVRIVLIDRAQVVGPELGVNPRYVIEQALSDAKIELRLGIDISSITSDSIYINNNEELKTRTVINATGLRASPLTSKISSTQDSLGRVHVDDYLRVTSVDNVFASGDVATANADVSHKTLMSCQHAIPTGKFAGYNAARELMGKELRTYKQADYVTCLDLGSAGAVFTTGWDRQVKMIGTEAKDLKRTINTEWIYPPTGDEENIFKEADIDSPPRRRKVLNTAS